MVYIFCNRKQNLDAATLLEIANAIPNDKVENVAIGLHFTIAQAEAFKDANNKGSAVEHPGTLEMLRTWRDRTSMWQNAWVLWDALIAAELRFIAEKTLL